MDIMFDNLNINPKAQQRLHRLPKRSQHKKHMEHGESKYHEEFYNEKIMQLPLAVTLGKKEIERNLLSTFDYYVTEKSDGLRLIFICDNSSKQCYFMDRKCTFYLIDHPFYTQTLMLSCILFYFLTIFF